MAVKELAVSANDNESLIWKVDTNGIEFPKLSFKKELKLIVGTGCQAIVYVNGQAIGAPMEAGAQTLNLKMLKDGDRLEIIGVKRDAQFVIKFGLSESNSVPYVDSEAKLTTKVSVRGECYCKVVNGHKIYSTYGCRNITAADVRNNIFGDITQILVDSLGKKLSEYSYLTIAQSVNDLSDTVKRLIEERLFSEGFLLERCSISQPFFGEDYGRLREQAIKDIEADERRQDERLREMRIIEKSMSAKAAAAPTTPPVDPNPKCPKCGKQSPAGTKFCQFCGNKLM